MLNNDREKEIFAKLVILKLEGPCLTTILSKTEKNWQAILLAGSTTDRSLDSVQADLCRIKKHNEDYRVFGKRVTTLFSELKQAYSRQLRAYGEALNESLKRLIEKQAISADENGLINDQLKMISVISKLDSLYETITFGNDQENRFQNNSKSISETFKKNNNSLFRNICNRNGHSSSTCYSSPNASYYSSQRHSKFSYCNKANHRIENWSIRKRYEHNVNNGFKNKNYNQKFLKQTDEQQQQQQQLAWSETNSSERRNPFTWTHGPSRNINVTKESKSLGNL